VVVRLMGATALGLCIAGATPLVGEARTHDTANRQTPETVAVKPGSPVVHLTWEANVQTDGGTFKFLSGQKKTEMRLLGEIEARSGRQFYRVQQPSPLIMTGGGRIQYYELRFLPEGGDEISLASIIVIEEDVAPATTAQFFSSPIPATLGTSWLLREDQSRIPRRQRRTMDEGATLCPPEPPP